MTTICTYCKYMYRDFFGAKRCGGPSQVEGVDYVNDGPRYTGASCLMTNRNGNCEEYQPTWWAKLLNLGG
jgi:hypothetical protein